MKSLREYIDTVETGPRGGDAIDIVLNEEVVVETDIVDVQGNDIFIGLDQRAYDMLEASGMIAEAETQTSQASGTISGLTSDAMAADPRYQEILKKELERAKQFGNSAVSRQKAYDVAAMRYKAELVKNPASAPSGAKVTGGSQTGLPEKNLAQAATAAPAAKPAAAPAATADQSSAETRRLASANAAAAPKSAPAAAPAATPAAKPAAAPAAGGYKGSAGAQAIQAANPDIIKDVNKIQAGQKIKLPNGQEYTIQPGDTLDKIARTQNVSGAASAAPNKAAPAAPAAPSANPATGVNAQGQNVTIKNPDGSTTNPETGETTPATGATNTATAPAAPAATAPATGDSMLGGGIKTSAGRNLDRVQRDLARMRKNAGMTDLAAPPASPAPAASTVPNPWQGKDPAKAAAFAKLSPEDQKWIGSADPTDPAVLARAPSQPGIGQQITKGVGNIGQGIKNIFSPKAKPATPPAAAPAAPAAPSNPFATPTTYTESADFDRMLELAGLDKKKELTESVDVREGQRTSASVKLQRALDRERARSEASKRRGEEVMAQARADHEKKQAAEKDKDVKEGWLDVAKGAWQGAKAGAKAAPAAAAPAAAKPRYRIDPATGKPVQVSPGTAATSAASNVPKDVDPVVWANMSAKQQQNYLSRQAKELGKGEPSTAARIAKGTAVAAVKNPVKTTAAAAGLYYLYNNPEVLNAMANFAQRMLGPKDDTMVKAEANLNNIAKNLAEQGKSREEIIAALSEAAGGADPATNKQWGHWAGRAADSAMRQANRPDTPDAPGSHVQRMRPSYDLSVPQPATNESRYQVYTRHPVTGEIRRINLASDVLEQNTESRSYFEHYACGTPRADSSRWSTRIWSDTPISKIMKGKQ